MTYACWLLSPLSYVFLKRKEKTNLKIVGSNSKNSQSTGKPHISESHIDVSHMEWYSCIVDVTGKCMAKIVFKLMAGLWPIVTDAVPRLVFHLYATLCTIT